MDWPLLKAVSRSFYLTLRLLPAPVRESIALAYLLARISDTRADGAETEAEKELLRREEEIRSWLAVSPDRAEIERVWTTIREGQAFDVERFTRPEPLSPVELDRYTYLVAGCVGEFWTLLCEKRLPGFASKPASDMVELGIRFGKALQLVNILRDRQADLDKGRVYVADSDRPAVLEQAREHLRAAHAYIEAVRLYRLRIACALPFLIAGETLDLVERNPTARRVKVSRGRVRVLFVRALFFN
ncbi:phytoene/squalene synthase family protein [soil metagenome]